MSSRVWLVALAVVVAAACGEGGRSPSGAFGDPAKVSVVAAFLPIAEAATAIGGDRVQVLNLTPVGASPHSIELRGKAVDQVSRADVVFYLSSGFQPAVQKLVEGLPGPVRAVDLLPGELLAVDEALPGVEGDVDGEVLTGGLDPHVWLDPLRFKAMAERIAEVLTDLDPGGAASFDANAARYAAQLDDLDAAFRKGLERCESRVVVTSHRAFGYLADRYRLRQVPIAGISPDEEPNARSMAAVAAEARREKVTVVFFESLVPKKLADTVAREVGAATDALNPVEGLTSREVDAGLDYLSIQRENLAALRKGLRCGGS